MGALGFICVFYSSAYIKFMAPQNNIKLIKIKVNSKENYIDILSNLIREELNKLDKYNKEHKEYKYIIFAYIIICLKIIFLHKICLLLSLTYSFYLSLKYKIFL